MKSSIFRPVKFWKASLMTLPVNVFFDLMRTTFGKIKTPFNKQTLTGDLEKFLSKKDIQDIIAGYLDLNDSRIIAAIAALDEPTVSELEAFFAGEISTAELHTLIVNLEERFIVYRFKDDDQSRLSLNPVLEPVLSDVAADRALLFESVSPDDVSHAGEKNNFIFDDRILAALLSFVLQNETFYKKGGGHIRQKTIGEINAIFSELPAEDIIGGLRVLGLFVKEGEQLLPDYQRFREFGDLNRRERAEYCAAGVYYFCHIWTNNTFSPRLLRQKFTDLATFIHIFFDSLDTERLYTTDTLRRIVYSINRNDQDSFFASLSDSLEKTGLLVPVTKQYWRIHIPAQDPPPEGSPSCEGAVITTDSPYSFLVYPEIAYNDVTAVAAFSRVTETGATVRFELNRDYTMRAFNRGVSADTMIELLKRLSHNRIDESLIFTLRDWEKRHGEVRLLNGIVLTLSPERRYLAETQPLAALISQTLAPGIYLLPQEAEEKAATALRKAGASIFTGQGNNSADAGKPHSTPSGGFYQPIDTSPYITFDTTSIRRDNAGEGNRKKPNPASTLIGGFHSILEKMSLGGEERDELSDRIDRRLILCESQLKDAVVRYEKLEARGLDYPGKSLIAKQAVNLQTPVEIYLSGRKKDGRVFGIPKALEKTDGDSILTVEQSGEILRIPLGKISLLRRVKKSIFENDKE